MGRTTRDAWSKLNRLHGHPDFLRVVQLLETIDGTVAAQDIDNALSIAGPAKSGLDPNARQRLGRLLDEAIGCQGADKGNIQLMVNGALRIAVHRGFDQDFLDHFSQVRVDGSSVCARALRSAEIVTVRDVLDDPDFAQHAEVAMASRIRGIQSAPVFLETGGLLGVLSVHFSRPIPLSPWRHESLARMARDVARALAPQRTFPEAAEL